MRGHSTPFSVCVRPVEYGIDYWKRRDEGNKVTNLTQSVSKTSVFVSYPLLLVYVLEHRPQVHTEGRDLSIFPTGIYKCVKKLTMVKNV